MSFLSTVFLLVGVVAGVLIPLYIGHALSVHSMTYVLYAVVAAVVAAIFVFLHSRLAKGSGAETEAPH